MWLEKLIQRHSHGKNVKLFYFMRAYMKRMMPRTLCNWQRKRLLKQMSHHPDYPALMDRVEYYCHATSCPLPTDSPHLRDTDYYKCPKVYRLDSEAVTRYFPPQLRWRMAPGDNTACFDIPTIVKSRPIADNNCMDVLLKLNHVRHFILLDDKLKWEDKEPVALFRGRIGAKENRLQFVRKFMNSKLVDAKCIDSLDDIPTQCVSRKYTIWEQLRYKFIVCLEGNDVASNLKWVMNSNSVAIMPSPTYETWFMEGRLQPNVHYIAIRPDFSDLEDKITYYLEHPELIQQILDNAHRWTAQFKDPRAEQLISLAVFDRYLHLTNNWSDD
ncbi:MAG: glycosyltransferase family 90 protein [Muribaculaceae bacterium]|nr:glycosyltransferase family 90 protein [Muribaculaceae bacterium]